MDGYSDGGSSEGNSLVPCPPETKRRKLQSSTQPSCVFVGDLEDCLVMEILIRIPCTKSLVRCKSVSKHWLSLLSSPYFISRRLLHPLKSDLFALVITDYVHYSNKQIVSASGPELPYPPFVFHGNPVCTLASCSDLLLCTDMRGSRVNRTRVYYICNPFTAQWTALPPVCDYPELDDAQMGLLSKFHCVKKGRGHYPAETRWWYQVVRILSGEDSLFAEIFSSDTGNWRDPIWLCAGYWRLSSPIFHEGMLHWLVSPSDDKNYEKLLVYDSNVGVGGGECHFIDCPEIIKPDGVRMIPCRTRYVKPIGVSMVCSDCLGSCCGMLRMLALVCFQYSPELRHLDRLIIWDLEDSKAGSWKIAHEVYVDEMLSGSWSQNFVARGGCNSRKRYISAMGIHQNDRDIVYLKFDKNVVICNLRTRELKLVGKTAYTRSDALPLMLPQWPTPLQALPRNAPAW